jgi:hypothetical protein
MSDLERIRAEREEQGLDPQVTDPSTLARVAAIVVKAVGTHDPTQ